MAWEMVSLHSLGALIIVDNNMIQFKHAPILANHLYPSHTDCFS